MFILNLVSANGSPIVIYRDSNSPRATSTCSPVCGPTDGYLAASGDDSITVSFTYTKDRTITATLGAEQTIYSPTPEFGPVACLVITISIIGAIVFSRRFGKNYF